MEFYLGKIASGVLISLGVLATLSATNRDDVLGQLCLYETMPHYSIENSMKMLFKFNPGSTVAIADTAEVGEESAPDTTLEEFEASGAESALIGVNDVIFQPETDYDSQHNHSGGEAFAIDDVGQLRDTAYLKKNFYVVDKRTDITPELFDVDNFLNYDFSIDNALHGPKVLVFHTHSNERYADSAGGGEGVLGVGELLCETLEKKYGVQALHNTQSFDIVDGKSHILGAYERMEPVVAGILRDNPSIQVAIDIHRDGVEDSVRLVENVNGKPTARIMFFNGLSRMYEDGVLASIDSLPNPNLEANLAFSFSTQLAVNSLYPGLARKVYLNAYRYSLHMLPRSLLIEVGAQTNTEEEARNAVEPLADALARVLLK